MNGGNKVKAVTECKELRKCGLCPRVCVAWHPTGRERKEFCKRALRAERFAGSRR